MSKEDRFFKFLNFSQFPEIIHGISNRSYGDMRFGRLKEEEIIRNKEKHCQEVSKITREAVRRAVSISFEVIKEKYYLVPKEPISLHDALQGRLGKPNTVLGQIPPPPD